MNHQPHTAAEPADLITDWFTDDDLSDEEEDQQEHENFPSVVDAARQRQDRRLPGWEKLLVFAFITITT